MRKQSLFILVVFCFQIKAIAQDVSYSNTDVTAFANSMRNESTRLMYNRNLQFLFDAFAGYDKDGMKIKKEKELAALRINTLKENYGHRQKYPDSIATGWHIVALTDNKEFYKEAKVYVSKNTIQQLVIQDCIRVRCTKSQVKNAAGAITLTDINSESETLNVYFIYDLDSTVLIDEPMQPGYVSFWTSKGKYLKERLMINDIERDFISKLHEAEPGCFETGVPFYMLKPGVYKLRVTKTGNDREEKFEIKSGMCLKYQLK